MITLTRKDAQYTASTSKSPGVPASDPGQGSWLCPDAASATFDFGHFKPTGKVLDGLVQSIGPHLYPSLFEPEPQSRRPEYQGRSKN